MADVTERNIRRVTAMSSINPDEKTDLSSWLKMVEQLRHAPEWPEDGLPIEMKQTHISVALLSRSYVIKLKKPVDFGLLDYTMLKKRLKACEDEVGLNRRLCPNTYIAVDGIIEIDGQTWEIYLRQHEEDGILCGKMDGESLALDTGGNLEATARAASDWSRLPASETISANTTGGGER